MCGPDNDKIHSPVEPIQDTYDPAPGLTLDMVKAKIPKKCFEKSLTRSLYYLVQDAALLSALYLARPYFCHAWWSPLRLLWWNLVGFLGWCLFVVGHDCGHNTFSNNKTINFIIGHIAHTPLLVPFTGWRASHRKHHLNHNHVANDHSWKPLTHTEYTSFMANWAARTIRCSKALLFIYPIYLVSHEGEHVSGNHFNPFDRKLFDPSETAAAAFSTVSILVWLGVLFSLANPLTLLDAYFVPYIVFCMWLSLVTYLHHTDPKGVYYRGSQWNYFKGALSTVDRSYGRVLNFLHHNIELHVVHHMFFTSIPHYHLTQATEAVKSLLGKAYMFDERPFHRAFLDNVEECRFVDDHANVVRYQGKHAKCN
mmetsp:Transcript_6514/g.8838  ORF Transcript_6514/g.8838 Transcript_6514/m.8838 type:complete len:367 (-) Transcript_6514:76-1176(-)